MHLVLELTNDITDISLLDPNRLQTMELGYKGVLGSKLLFTADLYRTHRENFVSPLRVVTPNVFLEPGALTNAVATGIQQALLAPENAGTAAALLALDAAQAGGNGNGSAVDELTNLMVAGTDNNGAAFIPYGTVSPTEATDPNAVMLAYTNFGDLTLYGFDAAAVFYPDEGWSVTGNYSYMSENVLTDPAGVRDLALNVPNHKFNLGVTHAFRELGLEAGARLRYRGAFPMASGVFVGDIEAYTLIDVHLAYELPLNLSKATVMLDAGATNLTDNGHLEFIGAPEIGRLVTAGITVRF